MTNGDKIRSMSDEELASSGLLVRPCDSDGGSLSKPCDDNWFLSCRECTLNWLQKGSDGEESWWYD